MTCRGCSTPVAKGAQARQIAFWTALTLWVWTEALRQELKLHTTVASSRLHAGGLACAAPGHQQHVLGHAGVHRRLGTRSTSTTRLRMGRGATSTLMWWPARWGPARVTSAWTSGTASWLPACSNKACPSPAQAAVQILCRPRWQACASAWSVHGSLAVSSTGPCIGLNQVMRGSSGYGS